MGKNSQYGVILDAGSSGTRVYVYKWKNPAVAKEKASSDELRSLPELKLKENKKIHPGVATFADNIPAVGPEHLDELIAAAKKEVPDDKHSETPIFLMATAGVRFLPKQQQTDLLHGICSYFRANTRFDLPDCQAYIQVISGETEGLYGWIAANYLMRGFDEPEDHDHGKGHHTYGFLDMGGASAQIAFAPNTTEAEKHSDDLKLVRMRTLDGTTTEHKVFTATWLGFGANKARDRFVESLRDQYDDKSGEIPDPCMPTGLRTTLQGEPIIGRRSSSDQATLVGTGEFEECLRKTYPLLGKDAPCENQPCLLNGQHVPELDFGVNHFLGVSEYWHTTHGVFGGKHKAYDLATYQHNVMEFCSRDWSDIESDLDKRKKSAEKKAADAREACFKASWVINVLYDGIGIPRVGLEGVGGANNVTKDVVDKAKEKGMIDPFKPVDTIDGVELSWTLGKMVLYAAGQVQPKGSTLPVGFGSNVASGQPKDFEEAGSSPLLSGPSSDDDDDWDDVLEKRPASSGSFAILIIVLLFAAYLLRKPERRRRLMSFARRHRKSGGRKPGRGFSFTNKLFGRGGYNYERVLEEGDASAFELGSVDSEENDSSDSAEGSSRNRRAGGLGTPNLNPVHEDLKLPSVLDRTGLVVRTGSTDRLGPPPQMLNAGRRSRAGSPTRQKSPMMTPLQED